MNKKTLLKGDVVLWNSDSKLQNPIRKMMRGNYKIETTRKRTPIQKVAKQGGINFIDLLVFDVRFAT